MLFVDCASPIFVTLDPTMSLARSLAFWCFTAFILSRVDGVTGGCKVAVPRMTCDDPVDPWSQVQRGVSVLNIAADSWTPSVSDLRKWLPDLQVSVTFYSCFIIYFISLSYLLHSVRSFLFLIHRGFIAPISRPNVLGM